MSFYLLLYRHKVMENLRHPYYATNEKATVILFVSNDCLILSQPLTKQANMH
jgi:hypothetical protein